MGYTHGAIWTDEMKARAAGMKRAGVPNKQIAERLGVTKESVTRICSQLGARRRLDGHGGGRGTTGRSGFRL